ncbi:MAG: glycosyltransferase [Pseudomonadota bacterium]
MSGPFAELDRSPPKLGAAPGARKPLTVLQMVDGAHLGGAEQAAREVATAIVAAGGRALICASGDAAHRVRVAGAESFVFRPESSLLNRKGNYAELVDIVADAGVDVIHARSPDMAGAGALAAAELGARFVTTFHRTYDGGLLGGGPRALTQADRVMAVSEDLADRISGKNLVRDQISVIPRGADMDIFAEEVVGPARTIQLADEWGLAEDTRPIVLAPGRLDPTNGFDILLQAVAQLKGAGAADFLCLIVGEGDAKYAEGLEAQAVKAGLAGSVKIAGSTQDMAAALKMAAVVVSAATTPPAAGRTMIEAQAMGRPVIAPAHGAMIEVVEDGVSGWLTSPGDANALAKAIRAALEMDDSLRAHIGMAGRARVRSRFTMDAMLSAILSVYEDVSGRTFRELVG